MLTEHLTSPDSHGHLVFSICSACECKKRIFVIADSDTYLIPAVILVLVLGTSQSVELSSTSSQSAIASLGLPVVRTDLRDRGGERTQSREQVFREI